MPSVFGSGIAPVAVLVILCVLAVVGYRALRGGLGGAKFVVTVTSDDPEAPLAARVGVRGTVPGKSAADVREFVAGLELKTGAKIWGVPDGARIEIRFRGVPDNLQQRIRNYVYN